MKIKLAAGMVMLMLLCSSSGAETLFIFNPEGKSSRSKDVIKILEEISESAGINAEVYVFASPDDFKNSVGRLRPEMAIVASYYYALMKDTYQWKALLSGHYKGTKVFRKILATHKSFKELAQLANKSLATVSLGATSLPYIQSQLPPGFLLEGMRIVSVSKDLDAVIALGLGQVEAAIVTRKSFDAMKNTHTEVLQDLHVLQELNSVEYPKIVLFPNAKAVKEITDMFKNMIYQGNTAIALEFFGITGFDTE